MRNLLLMSLLFISFNAFSQGNSNKCFCKNNGCKNVAGGGTYSTPNGLCSDGGTCYPNAGACKKAPTPPTPGCEYTCRIYNPYTKTYGIGKGCYGVTYNGVNKVVNTSTGSYCCAKTNLTYPNQGSNWVNGVHVKCSVNTNPAVH